MSAPSWQSVAETVRMPALAGLANAVAATVAVIAASTPRPMNPFVKTSPSYGVYLLLKSGIRAAD